MNNLMHFISQNITYVLVLIAAIIVYLIFEIQQKLKKRYLITSTKAIHLANREKARFIDIRDSEKFKAAHIINAENISYKTLSESRFSLTKQQLKSPLVIYSDEKNQVVKAYQILKNQHEQIYVLEGGIQGWKSASLPISKN